MNLQSTKRTLTTTARKWLSVILLGFSALIAFSAVAQTNTLPNVYFVMGSSSSNGPMSRTWLANATDADGTITKVEFYDGANLVTTVTSSSGGNNYTTDWITLSTLGDHVITAKAYDNDGGVKTSSPVTFHINGLPEVSITSPANAQRFTPGSNVALTASATDTDGSISKVDFYNGATLIGTATSAPYSITWNSVAAGTYSITAKATDNDGALTTSSTITVVAGSNSLPTMMWQTPWSNESTNYSFGYQLSVSAKDVDGTISKVEFYDGTTLLATVTTPSGSNAFGDNYTTTDTQWFVSEGSHVLTAKVYDNDGGVTISPTRTLRVNAAPTTNISSPTSGQRFTPGSNITLTANAADIDGTITKVDFYNGATLIGTATSAPYSITWNSVAAGTYSITAKATDNDGKVGTSAAVNVISGGNSLPTMMWLTPWDATQSTNYSFNYNLSVAAQDADGTIAKVEFYEGNTLLATVTTPTGASNAYGSVYTTTDQIWITTEGSHVLTAKVYDNDGGVTISPIRTLRVNAAPTVSITAPTSGQKVSPNTAVTLTANAADSDGTITKVDFYSGATLIGTATAAPYSFTWTPTTTGVYSITAKATDNESKVATSAAVSVPVSSGNILPTMMWQTPWDATQSTNYSFGYNLSVAAQDADGTIAKVEYYDGTTLLATVTTSNGTNPSYGNLYTTADQVWITTEGTHILTAKVYDNDGGVTNSPTRTLRVNAAPTSSISSPTSGQRFTPGSNITLTANAADSDGTITKVDFYNGATLIGTATSAPYSITWNSVAAGTYSITAKATDNDGKVGTSAAVNVISGGNSLPTMMWLTPWDATQSTNYSFNYNLSVAAQDADGTIAKVEFYEGNTLLATVTTPTGASNAYGSVYTTTDQIWITTEGSHVLTAKVYDNDGGVTISPTRTLRVNAAPSVSVSAPTSGQVIATPTNTNVTLTASATDSDGTITKVDFYNGTTLLGSATAAPYTITWSNVVPGAYSVTAKATDNDGKEATSAAVSFSVMANAAPTVSITSPTQNQTFTAPASITLTANAADADNNLVKVEFYQSGNLIDTAFSSPYSVVWNNVALGSYSITAVATDALGAQTTSDPVSITVTQAQAGVYYIQSDQLGTPRLITNESNAVVWRSLPITEPFGNSPVEEDPNSTGTNFKFNLRFPGQYADKETNINYNFFRDYNPSTGRYLQSDPTGLGGGLDTYAYVGGKPTSMIDFFGLSPNCISSLLSTTAKTSDDVIRTVLAQVSLPVPIPTGPGFGPSGPGKSPISPEINFDMWEVKYTVSKLDTYRVTESVQHLLVKCSETRTDDCGKTTTYNFTFYSDVKLAPEKSLIDSRFNYGYEKVRKLFSFSEGL